MNANFVSPEPFKIYASSAHVFATRLSPCIITLSAVTCRKDLATSLLLTWDNTDGSFSASRAESTWWNLRGGIYAVESTRWNLRGGCSLLLFWDSAPILASLSISKHRYWDGSP